MFQKSRDWQKISYATIAVFMIAFAVFAGFHLFSIKTDIQTHVRWVRSIAQGDRSFRPNFLYQLLVYVVSFFHKEYLPLYFGSVLLLSVAVAAKYAISQKYLVDYGLNSLDNPHLTDKTGSVQLSMIAGLALVFMFSLPLTVLIGGDFYLTNFPPNVWHNPTTILLMPFALILFLVSHNQLIQPTKNRILILTILCVINILIKPSFFFVFCIVYPIFFLVRHGIKKKFWLNLLPVIVGVLLVFMQYIILYISTGFSDSDGGIALGFFTVWSYYSPSILLSFIGSIFFPLLYTVFYPKDVLRDDLFQYVASLFIVAVLMFSVLIETGGRKYDGNFGWQYFITNYMLYMVIISFMLKKITKNYPHKNIEIIKVVRHASWKDKVLILFFVLQFLLGIYYVLRFFI